MNTDNQVPKTEAEKVTPEPVPSPEEPENKLETQTPDQKEEDALEVTGEKLRFFILRFSEKEMYLI